MPIADMQKYQQYSKITNIVFIVLCMVLRLIKPKLIQHDITGLILGLCPTNERRRYKVTPSLIRWVQS